MTPIPKYLLNMNATLYHRAANDEYGNPTYGAAVNLESVYIEEQIAGTIIGEGEKVERTFKMFFDAENSAPIGTAFYNLDKIVFAGVTYYVRNNAPFCNPFTGLVHHWEITLYGS